MTKQEAKEIARHIVSSADSARIVMIDNATAMQMAIVGIMQQAEDECYDMEEKLISVLEEKAGGKCSDAMEKAIKHFAAASYVNMMRYFCFMLNENLNTKSATLKVMHAIVDIEAEKVAECFDEKYHDFFVGVTRELALLANNRYKEQLQKIVKKWKSK